MKFKINLLVAAAAIVAAGAANASLKFGDATTNGNSSVAFVAMDDAASTSLTIDLGVQFTSLLSGGALDAAGTTAVWNFAANTFTVNGVTQAGTYAYSVNDASFRTAIAGGSYRWGVIAGDSVSAGTINQQNILFTSTALDFDNGSEGITNASVAGGATNVSNLFADSNGKGTQTAGVFGANTATAGGAFLGTTMAASGLGDFGQLFGTNSFLNATTDVAYLMKAQLNNSGVIISQLGTDDNVGSALLTEKAATFTFDEATQTLTYINPPVPEPSTSALLLAGLAAVGFVARRRAAR